MYVESTLGPCMDLRSLVTTTAAMGSSSPACMHSSHTRVVAHSTHSVGGYPFVNLASNVTFDHSSHILRKFDVKMSKRRLAQHKKTCSSSLMYKKHG